MAIAIECAFRECRNDFQIPMGSANSRSMDFPFISTDFSILSYYNFLKATLRESFR